MHAVEFLSDIFSAQFVCVCNYIESQPRRAGVRITGVRVEYPAYLVVTSYKRSWGKRVAEVSGAGGRDWAERIHQTKLSFAASWMVTLSRSFLLSRPPSPSWRMKSAAGR